MSIPFLCLLGIVTWTLILTLSLVVWRLTLVARGDFAANEFPHGEPHGSDRYWRLNRAHTNAIENLPLIATLIIIGHLIGLESELFSQFACIYLLTRILHSIIHIASNSVFAVQLRFSTFLIQLICLGGIIVEIAMTVF